TRTSSGSLQGRSTGLPSLLLTDLSQIGAFWGSSFDSGSPLYSCEGQGQRSPHSDELLAAFGEAPESPQWALLRHEDLVIATRCAPRPPGDGFRTRLAGRPTST